MYRAPTSARLHSAENDYAENVGPGVGEHELLVLYEAMGCGCCFAACWKKPPATDSPKKIVMNTMVCQAGAMSGRVDGGDVRFAGGPWCSILLDWRLVEGQSRN